MANARSAHTASLLEDGRMLVVGGAGISVEAYDPASGSWLSSVTVDSGRLE